MANVCRLARTVQHYGMIVTADRQTRAVLRMAMEIRFVAGAG